MDSYATRTSIGAIIMHYLEKSGEYGCMLYYTKFLEKFEKKERTNNGVFGYLGMST